MKQTPLQYITIGCTIKAEFGPCAKPEDKVITGEIINIIDRSSQGKNDLVVIRGESGKEKTFDAGWVVEVLRRPHLPVKKSKPGVKEDLWLYKLSDKKGKLYGPLDTLVALCIGVGSSDIDKAKLESCFQKKQICGITSIADIDCTLYVTVCTKRFRKSVLKNASKLRIRKRELIRDAKERERRYAAEYYEYLNRYEAN